MYTASQQKLLSAMDSRPYTKQSCGQRLHQWLNSCISQVQKTKQALHVDEWSGMPQDDSIISKAKIDQIYSINAYQIHIFSAIIYFHYCNRKSGIG